MAAVGVVGDKPLNLINFFFYCLLQLLIMEVMKKPSVRNEVQENAVDDSNT